MIALALFSFHNALQNIQKFVDSLHFVAFDVAYNASFYVRKKQIDRIKKIMQNIAMSAFTKIPRIMLASASSASGKTTITAALIKVLSKKAEREGKSKPCAFKCGPDFIDPMFHKKAGAESANLDSFFLPKEKLRSLFCHYAKGSLAIIEGAMGFYDGFSQKSESGSAFEIANILDCPVILVVDASKSSRSILALISGFKNWKSNSKIEGVILNNISKMRAQEMKDVIENEIGIKMLGSLEKKAQYAIESRHLGLMTPESDGEVDEKLSLLEKEVEESFDIEKILEIAQSASEISFEDNLFTESLGENKTETKKIQIAVAKDEAFCFYYRENLDLLCSMGAKLVEFSPLKEEKLPDGTDALYLGGGYPELFPEKLFENTTMIKSIKNSVLGGLPTIAECGGFLYLQALGVLKGTFKNTGKLCRFGYATIKANNDTLLLKEGQEIKAHEFHYFDTSENGSDCTATKMSGKSWLCIHSSPFSEEAALPPFSETLNIWAGFPHLYFLSNTDFAKNFVSAALRFQKQRTIVRTKCSVCPKKRAMRLQSQGK